MIVDLFFLFDVDNTLLADYLGALERYRLENMHDPRLLRISNWLVDYPLADRLYPGALDAVKHVSKSAPVVILSDGDAVFQPRKVDRSGLWREFDGHELIYIHKEEELDDVERLYPARRQAAHPGHHEKALG
jgi:hypothetical protein